MPLKEFTFTDKNSYVEYVSSLRAQLIKANSTCKQLKFEICNTFKSGGVTKNLQQQWAEQKAIVNTLLAQIKAAKLETIRQLDILCSANKDDLFVCPNCGSCNWTDELTFIDDSESRSWLSKNGTSYSGNKREIVKHVCETCNFEQIQTFWFGKLSRNLISGVQFK